MTEDELIMQIKNFLEKYDYDALTWDGEILLHKGEAILDVQDFPFSSESDEWNELKDIWDLADRMYGLEEVKIERE